jgi:GH35 family endo-1,4-beta-xylanase
LLPSGFRTVHDFPTLSNGTISSCPDNTKTPLRLEASKKNILIGSGAINTNYLNDTQYAAVLAEQLQSLSPENELKWSFIHPTEEHYNWETLNRLVDFAGNHSMVVKGHGLISSCCNADYLLNITDPTASRAAMKNHFEAIMHRYDSSMDRWDVVTEALETMEEACKSTTSTKYLGQSTSRMLSA